MYHSNPNANAQELLERKRRSHEWQPDPCPQSPSYPETPQPSSPDTQLRPVLLSHPSLGTPTGNNCTVGCGTDWECGKSLLNGARLLPQQSRTVNHEKSSATMTISRMMPHEQQSKRKSIQATTTPRQHRTKKFDPLGSSLHSYLQEETPTSQNNYNGPPPATIISEANYIVEEQESKFTRRRSVRDRPSNMRARRSITMPLPPRKSPETRSRNLMDYPPVPPFLHGNDESDYHTINKNCKSKKSRSQKFHTDPFFDHHVVSCSRRANACYLYTTSQSQPLGSWTIFVFLVSLLCPLLYFANDHMQLQYAHKQLVEDHEEKTQLLLAANKQATMFSTSNNLFEATKGSLSILGGSTAPISHPFHQHHDGHSQQHQHQQHPQVLLLQKTIQDMATRSLRDTFPKLTQTGKSTIETQVMLEGHGSPLFFAIAYEQVPYTAWTWLDQVQRGIWDHAQLTHVGDDDFIEIRMDETATTSTTTTTTTTATVPAGRSRTPSALLSFQEEGFPSSDEDRFVLGVRNPAVGAPSSGLILTIHLTQGTCGQIDDEEVCFGKVVGGFDSLRMIRSQKQTLSVESIQVQF